MPLTPGTILGQYEIRSALGAGGMGEVYRAHDTRLDREVAIKVLPQSLTTDPERLRRFEQEARAAAALNHPNILAVYQMATEANVSYMVTELLNGETLRERLRRGAIPIRKAIEYAVHIAYGLAAAHEKGIAHRDLKPENLFLTKDGRVKILDFGLAKLMHNPASSDGSTVSLRDQTEAGRVLGTVGYMSPEQVRGQPADARSDIFALGCVLYEMLTGKRAFRKPSSVETMNAILNDDPAAASDITPAIPPALERVVHRCLEKAPERRFQSSSDLAFALDALSNSAVSSSGSSAAVVTSRIRKEWLVASLIVVTVLATLATVGYFRALPQPVPKLSNFVQLTHDGQPKWVVGADRSRLYLSMGGRDYKGLAEMSIAGGQPRAVPIQSSNAFGIASLSPDGLEFLGVESHDNTGTGPFWSIPVLGGAPRRLAEIEGNNGAWSPDGKKLAFTKGTNSLFLANADGTDSRKLISMPDPAHLFDPTWSPDGARLRFVVKQTIDDLNGSYWEVSLNGTGIHRLMQERKQPYNWECCGHWTPDGKFFLFLSGNQVWALPQESGLLHSRPKPAQLTSSPIPLLGPIPSIDGKKVFVIGQTILGELQRYDAKSGKFQPFLGGISAEYVAFSKDRQWVVYSLFPEGTLWRSRADGSERLQLTYPPTQPLVPRWSPDGTKIVYADQPVGKPPRIFEVSPQGGSPRELMPEDSMPQSDPTWSPDGGKILFGGESNDAAAVIRIFDLTTRKISTLPGSQGLFSPR